MAKSEAVVAYRYRITENNQLEGVELVKDDEDPDGTIQISSGVEFSPPNATSLTRQTGVIKKGPDISVRVKLRPTGIIFGEVTDEIRSEIERMWENYQPLNNDT